MCVCMWGGVGGGWAGGLQKPIAVVRDNRGGAAGVGWWWAGSVLDLTATRGC